MIGLEGFGAHSADTAARKSLQKEAKSASQSAPADDRSRSEKPQQSAGPGEKQPMSQPQETDAQRTAAGTEDSAEAPAPDQSGTEPVRRDDAGDFSDVLLELDQVEPVVIRPQGPAETVSDRKSVV